jgi:hypothetical protein
LRNAIDQLFAKSGAIDAGRAGSAGDNRPTAGCASGAVTRSTQQTEISFEAYDVDEGVLCRLQSPKEGERIGEFMLDISSRLAITRL